MQTKLAAVLALSFIAAEVADANTAFPSSAYPTRFPTKQPTRKPVTYKVGNVTNAWKPAEGWEGTPTPCDYDYEDCEETGSTPYIHYDYLYQMYGDPDNDGDGDDYDERYGRSEAKYGKGQSRYEPIDILPGDMVEFRFNNKQDVYAFADWKAYDMCDFSRAKKIWSRSSRSYKTFRKAFARHEFSPYFSVTKRGDFTAWLGCSLSRIAPPTP